MRFLLKSHKSGDHFTVTRTAIQKALLKEDQTWICFLKSPPMLENSVFTILVNTEQM